MALEYDTTLSNFPSIFSLEGKVAVVVGGSRGLGLSGASAFLQAGCSKVYISSRKQNACEEACAALNKLPNLRPGAKAIPIAADSSKTTEIERLVKEVEKTTDHVDILFANAGATWGAPFDKHDDASFSKVMDLNVKAVFFCAQKFAPLLAKKATKQDPSRIITTASVAGIIVSSTGENSTPSYTASKAAVIHLTRHLAVELGPRNILSNAICPGFFPSKLANGLIDIRGGKDKLAAAVPNGRLGKPEDIGGLVVFLSSRAASHINGAHIAIDGGESWNGSKL